MLALIDERDLVLSAYESSFGEIGVAAARFRPDEFGQWVRSAPATDIESVEAFLLGNCSFSRSLSKQIREKSNAPVIALGESQTVDQMLELFAAGVDDFVRKPIHVREILARIGAIRRRSDGSGAQPCFGRLQVFFDGRSPEVDNKALLLPCRERRILEYLVCNSGKRVTKTQIFNAIYGLFDENVDETIVESHISKLRKKLRHVLGYDPIESKRYLGYRFGGDSE